MATFDISWKEAASEARHGRQVNFDPNWFKKLPKAKYCKDLPEFMLGSPTVEALGPIYEMEDILRKVRFRPPYNRERETKLSKSHRLHHLPLMWEIVEPLPAHYVLMNAISINVRHRQLKQCPFKRRRDQLLYDLPEKGIQFTRCTNDLKTPAPAILMYGPSGQGKGVLIESCLRLFPYQACRHDAYTDGIRVDIAQVVWTKIDCSFDATVQGIAYGLFAGLDNALGTDYLSEFTKKGLTIDTLLIHWQRLAVKHSLGILWVDEVQCLETGGKANAKKILNFFLKVSNLLGVTIIFSGTNAVAKLFAPRFHNARRVCSGGTVEVELYKTSADPRWNEMFMPTLFRYQWVKQPLHWEKGESGDRTISDKVFALTCGIHVLAVLMWILVQKAAIENGTEVITIDGLQAVYDRQFKPLHPALAALRSKRKDRLARYEDMLPVKDVLDNLMRETCGAELERALAFLRARARARTTS
jgi:hypothetical protein